MKTKKSVNPVQWIPIDKWRGYYQPANAVVGASDTGMERDSPMPSNIVQKELLSIRNELKKKGILTKLKTTQSSNPFMVKRWLVVKNKDFKKAYKLGKNLHPKMTEFVHPADLPKKKVH